VLLALLLLLGAISGQYLASYFLGRRWLVAATFIFFGLLAWWGYDRVGLAIEIGKNPRRPGDELAPIAALWLTVFGIIVALILSVSAAVIGWRHRFNRGHR
jgi:hypothetical protein